MGLLLPAPWSDDKQLSALLRDPSPRSNPFTQIRSLLVQLEPLIMRNFADFKSFALSVDYLERMFWRETVVIQLTAKKHLQRETTDALIQTIAERDRDMADALTKDWNG